MKLRLLALMIVLVFGGSLTCSNKRKAEKTLITSILTSGFANAQHKDSKLTIALYPDATIKTLRFEVITTLNQRYKKSILTEDDIRLTMDNKYIPMATSVQDLIAQNKQIVACRKTKDPQDSNE